MCNLFCFCGYDSFIVLILIIFAFSLIRLQGIYLFDQFSFYFLRKSGFSFFFFLIFFFNDILVCLHSFYVCMYVCMYGCVGSSFLCEGFLQLWQAGATLHCGARASHHRGLSLPRTGSRRAGSVIAAHGPSCSAACETFPDQGSNPRSPHRQADSQPLRHQGSPGFSFLKFY